MAKNGSPAPEFETDEDRSYFLIRLPVHEKAAWVEEGPEVTPEVGKMLRMFDGEMARQEIMSRLGLRDEKHFREHYQQPAIASGLVEMTIPEKPNSRLQKYRLTALGVRMLEDSNNQFSK
jgi:ATP-dependent DNA helicase RecG